MRNRRVRELLLIIFLIFPLISSSTALANSQSIDGAFSWLLANQSQSGYWGEIILLRDTPVVIEALAKVKPDSPNISIAKIWLDNQETPNNDYVARKIKALNLLGVDTSTLSTTLLSTQNPDGGFGIAEGYISDTLDTLLALPGVSQWQMRALLEGRRIFSNSNYQVAPPV